VNGDLEIIFKEAIVAYFKLLSGHLHGEIGKTTKHLSQDSWYPGRDLNPKPTEYKSRVFTNQLRRSVSHLNKARNSKGYSFTISSFYGFEARSGDLY
jgi:hypothetical protein